VRLPVSPIILQTLWIHSQPFVSRNEIVNSVSDHVSYHAPNPVAPQPSFGNSKSIRQQQTTFFFLHVFARDAHTRHCVHNPARVAKVPVYRIATLNDGLRAADNAMLLVKFKSGLSVTHQIWKNDRGWYSRLTTRDWADVVAMQVAHCECDLVYPVPPSLSPSIHPSIHESVHLSPPPLPMCVSVCVSVCACVCVCV
jgi:hypothetical protein